MEHFSEEIYDEYPTELGILYIDRRLRVEKDTITIGFQKFLWLKSFTVKGIFAL